MKKLLTIAVIILAVIVMNACKSSDTPENVAENFLNHINKKEFAEAKKLATPESAESIDMLENFAKMGNEPVKQTEIKNIKCVAKEGSKDEEEKVICDYTENGEAKRLDLVKKDGKWLVDLKKESPDTDTMEPDTTMVEDTTKK